MLTPLPGCTPTKPGSATLPFFSIAPAIVDFNGKEIEGPGNGILVIKKPWPSIARTVVGNHERYEMTYFHKFKGYFSTGDGKFRSILFILFCLSFYNFILSKIKNSNYIILFSSCFRFFHFFLSLSLSFLFIYIIALLS